MPRYSFSVSDGALSLIDDTDLPDLAAARQAALGYASALLLQRNERFWDGADLTVAVKADDGLLLILLTSLAISAPALDEIRSQGVH